MKKGIAGLEESHENKKAHPAKDELQMYAILY
jgi:hypothetical protein